MLAALMNLKREPTNHNVLLNVMYKEFESHSSYIQLISKDCKCELIPAAIKLFSPLLFNILKSFSPTDEISILIPDCPVNAVSKLYELISVGFINNIKPEGKAEPNPSTKLECVQDIVAAGNLLGITIDSKTIMCDDEITQHNSYDSIERSKSCPKQEFSEICLNQEYSETCLKQDRLETYVTEERSETYSKQFVKSEEEYSENYLENCSNVDSCSTAKLKKDIANASSCMKNEASNSRVQVASFAKLPFSIPEIKKSKNGLYDTSSCSGNVFKAPMINVPSNPDLLFKCQYCGCGFNAKFKLEHHERTEHVRLYCKLCDYSCIGKADLRFHIGHAHRNICKDCKEKFTTIKDLRRHREGSRQQPKRCKHCGHSFRTFCSMIQHMKTVHSILQDFF